MKFLLAKILISGSLGSEMCDPVQIWERKLGYPTSHLRSWDNDILFGWKIRKNERMVLWWSRYFMNRWEVVKF